MDEKLPKITPKSESSHSVGSIYKRLFHYVVKYYKLSLPLTIITILMISYTAIIPLITKAIFDNALAQKNLHLLSLLISLLIFGAIVLILLWIAADLLQSFIGVKIANDLRLRMYQKIHQLSHMNFRENNPGNLLHRFESIYILTYVLTQVFWGTLGNLLFIILATGVMFSLNWKISILVVLIIPIIFMIVNKLSGLAKYQAEIREAEEASLFHMAREDIDFNEVIPLLRISAFRMRKFKKKLASFKRKDFRFNTFLLLTHTTVAAGIIILELLIIAYGSYLILVGQLSLGSFVGFITMFSAFSYSVYSFGEFYPALVRGSIAMDIIEQLLMFPTSKESKSELPALGRLADSISFEQVNFEFSDRQSVLKDINIELKVGETIAIIGANGSGKSTLLELLLGQEEPTSGQILVDGKNISQYSPESLLAQIGFVSQHPCLFLMSIADNIRLGKLDANQEEIVAAAKLVEIHDEIVALPKGYDTLLVWGGGNLSAGQVQRIMLARALISNPAILILDEATSALDLYNRIAINQTLMKLRKKTIVLVTHHLKDIADFKKIIFLEKGGVVEIGNHKTLINAKGAYSKMWEKQSAVEINEGNNNINIKLGWLKKLPLFESLSDKLLSSCVDKFMIEEIPQDSIVLEEGGMSKKFYIIVRGRVSISKRMSDMTQKTVAILEDGDYFGEISLLSMRPHTRRVTTLERSVFLVLHQGQFNEVLESLPTNKREEIIRTSVVRLESVEKDHNS